MNTHKLCLLGDLIRASVQGFLPLIAAVLCEGACLGAPGDLDAEFDPVFYPSFGSVNGVTTQLDRSILTAGYFRSIDEVGRVSIARLREDGTLDASFDAHFSSSSPPYVSWTVVQRDGKVLLGPSLARYHYDGSLDSSFDPQVQNSVYFCRQQLDGRLIIAGSFNSVGGVSRPYIARLNTNGSIDPGYAPIFNSSIHSAAMQPDGAVVVSGYFTSVNGVSRNGFARIRGDGSLDTAFSPAGLFAATILLIQPDGKLLICPTQYPTAQNPFVSVYRLHSSGQLDSNFSFRANAVAAGAVMQADGKIIITGEFNQIGNSTGSGVARLNADGSVDASFSRRTGYSALGVALQADGKVLAGNSQSALARLQNGEATGTLTVSAPGRVTWMRGGTAPEVYDVEFETSADGGVNWTPLGMGTRIFGGWEKMGLALPPSGHVRAIARVNCGIAGSSSGLEGAVAAYGGGVGLPEVSIEGPAGVPLADGSAATLPLTVTGSASSANFRIANTGAGQLQNLAITIDGTNAADFKVGTIPNDSVSGPFGSAAFTVMFSPLAAGERRATLHVASNDSDESSYDITLTGEGIAPDIAVEQPYGTNIASRGGRDFGGAGVGRSSSLYFVIKNLGPAELRDVVVSITGDHAADFSASGFGPMIYAGYSASMSVSFGPRAIGKRTAILRIASNDPDENPFELMLSGTGLPDADASVTGIETDAGVMVPRFARTTMDYTMHVSNSVSSLTINVSPGNRFAALTIAGNPTVADEPSAPIGLAAGVTSIPIVVTSQDGSTTRTYTLGITRAEPAPGDLDMSVSNLLNYYSRQVYSLAVQADGKTLLGGHDPMFALSGYGSAFARLSSAGSLESHTTFPRVIGTTTSVAVQWDGKILFGGNWSYIPVERRGMVRLDADGGIDADFDPNVTITPTSVHGSTSGTVTHMLVQPDGRILIGGRFDRVGAVARANVARLHPNGTLDSSWNSLDGNNFCHLLALPDGKTLLAADGRLFRLLANGSRDTSFSSTWSGGISTMVVQRDGKILVGHSNGVRRLNADGTTDDSFLPAGSSWNLDGNVTAIALQADGKMIITGGFTRFYDQGYVVSTPRNKIARLHTDGSLDLGFDPDVGSELARYGSSAWANVTSAALQADGKIWIGGDFYNVGGVPQRSLARLLNDPATQSLTVADGSRIRWQRGGSAPELQDVIFETSLNGGVTWASLGAVGNVAGGWEKVGVALPNSGFLRARGRATGGLGNGSSGVIEQSVSFSLTPAVKARIISPVNGTALASTTLQLAWDAGNRVTGYFLRVGATPGGAEYYSASESTRMTRAVTVPADRRIHVTLFSLINGAYQASYHVFEPAPSARATLVSPTNNSTLTGNQLKLTWTAGTGVSKYVIWVGSSYGGYDLAALDAGTTTSRTFTVPQDGGHIYVTLWSLINGGYQAENYWFTTALSAAGSYPARLTSHVNTSTLSSATLNLRWDAGAGVTSYALGIGSTPNGYDLYSGLEGVSLARSVAIPGDGRRIHVTLHSLISGAYQSNAYWFTAPTLPDGGAAQITNPASGSTLADANLPLAWSAAAGATQYHIFAGSSPGGYDLYSGGQGTSLSKTLTAMPLDGRTIYVTLYSWINGAWKQSSARFTTANIAAGSKRALISAPANGSALAGASATFSWVGGVGMTSYALWIGSSVGAYDLWSSSETLATTSRTVTLPTDGRKLYVTLYSMINGAWQGASYLYTAASVATTKAAMIAPVSGSTFSGAAQTFTWTPSNAATAYALWIGRAPGGYDLYAGAEGTNTARTVTTLPTDGSPVYVTLYSLIKGAWQSNEYFYNAAL